MHSCPCSCSGDVGDEGATGAAMVVAFGGATGDGDVATNSGDVIARCAKSLEAGGKQSVTRYSTIAASGGTGTSRRPVLVND